MFACKLLDPADPRSLTSPELRIACAQTCRRAALTVGYGAAVCFYLAMIASIPADGFWLDPGAALLVILAIYVAHASVSASTWTAVLMTMSFLILCILMIALWRPSNPVRFGEITIQGNARWLAAAALIPLLIWTATAAVLCWRARLASIRIQRRRNGLCMLCGSFPNAALTLRCTNCGFDIGDEESDDYDEDEFLDLP